MCTVYCMTLYILYVLYVRMFEYIHTYQGCTPRLHKTILQCHLKGAGQSNMSYYVHAYLCVHMCSVKRTSVYGYVRMYVLLYAYVSVCTTVRIYTYVVQFIHKTQCFMPLIRTYIWVYIVIPLLIQGSAVLQG